jgi:hypothetical protein
MKLNKRMGTKIAQHTLGPWSVSPVGRSVYGHRSEVSYDGSPYTPRICDCIFGGKGDEQLAANAHLIAAAPELLEALEMIHRVMIQRNIGEDEREVADAAWAAIQKAKGGV